MDANLLEIVNALAQEDRKYVAAWAELLGIKTDGMAVPEIVDLMSKQNDNDAAEALADLMKIMDPNDPLTQIMLASFGFHKFN